MRETRNQLPPKPEKIQNYNSCLSAGCPHTSPWIAVDKSGNGWRSRHLFCWNWDIVEKRTEGWYSQTQNMEEEDMQDVKGRFSFQLWVVFNQGPSEVKCINKSENVTPGLLYTDANKVKIPSL